jgi:cytoskeletal protein RodZ
MEALPGAGRHSRPQHRRKQKPKRGPWIIGLVLLVALAIGLVIGLSGPSKTPAHVGAPTTTRPAGGIGTVPTASSSSETTVSPTSSTIAPSSSTTAPSTSTSVATTTTVPTIAPTEVSVEIINGSGAPGVADTTAQSLKEIGFVVEGTENAEHYGYTSSIAQYPYGLENAATLVCRYVSGPCEAQLDTDIKSSVVYLVLGSQFTGVAH